MGKYFVKLANALFLVLVIGGCTSSVEKRWNSCTDKKWERNEVNLLSGFGNMYNPHIVETPDEIYLYKMYFFGWSYKDCNPGLTTGCDAIFVARSMRLEGPWEVYCGENGWHGSDQVELWIPVIAADIKFYDQWHNGDPSVVKYNGVYYMAYSSTGFDQDGINPHGPDGKKDKDGFISVVMGATSTDGIHWTKSKYPLLIYEPEIGQMETYTGSYQGNFHRPSLMRDKNRWRLWFDYWQPDNKGMGMGHAECYGDPMHHDDWRITHDIDNALIMAWPNPDVVKVGNMYYSVADPSGYKGIKNWPGRQIREAISDDGINWKVFEFISPDSDTPADQIPEAFVTKIGDQNWLYIFYSCQIGGNPYDYRYDRIRCMKKRILCDP
jgi:hypothetical protein